MLSFATMPGDEPKEFSREVENLIAAFRGVPEDRGRSRSRAVTPLAGLIDELLLKYKVGQDSIEQRLRDRWSVLVGAANASYSHPLAVERGLLVVLVSHSVVRNELFLHRESIVAQIRQVPGCAEIRGLALRIG